MGSSVMYFPHKATLNGSAALCETALSRIALQARSQDFSWEGGGVRLGSEDRNL